MSIPLPQTPLVKVEKKKQQGTTTDYTFINAASGPSAYALWRPESDYTAFLNALSTGKHVVGSYDGSSSNAKTPEGESQPYFQLLSYSFS